MANYDLTNVAAAFLGGMYEERAELVTELGAAIRRPSKPVQMLIAQVAHECLEQPDNTPVNTIQIGIMYGLVLGVLLEKDRADRTRRVV